MFTADRSRPLQIFDLGGVVINVDARKTLAAFEALGMAHLEGSVSNSHAVGGIFSDYCEGRVSTDDFIAGVRVTCGLTATDKQIADAWNAMLGSYYDESIALVRQLRSEGFKVALLSNINDLHVVECRRLFPGPGSLDGLFDAAFYSHEIHAAKPRAEAWQTVLDHFGMPASEAAFYDDSQINIEACERLGMRGVRVDWWKA